ncbi:MAG: hypothetical protein J0H86_03440 [Xanthomonadaceae bacterium]|nr:hypothetical protein [Xanthomonadaceae bacterium]
MAIVILGNTGCSLCAEVLVAGQRIVASPHFIQNQSHPLWRYSDSAMHEDCFRQWPHREEFIAEYPYDGADRLGQRQSARDAGRWNDSDPPGRRQGVRSCFAANTVYAETSRDPRGSFQEIRRCTD